VNPAPFATLDRTAPVTLDVVVPLYNEEDVIGALVDRLSSAFAPEKLAAHGVRSVRVLAIDDGSTDKSAAMLAERIRAGFPAMLVRLSRNFGHQNAVCAGLDLAEADLVAIMDADLQDPPELVLDMVDRWRQGADVVFGRRRRRMGNPLKRLGYWGFYRMVGFLSEIRLPLDTGDFCLVDRPVIEAMRSLPEHLRFVRGLRAWVGFRQEALDFDRPERQAGAPKYTWSRLYKLATDGIASMSTRPLQVAQLGTFFFGLLTIAFLALLLWGYLASPSSIPTPFLVAYVLLASGFCIVSFSLYILGAYIGRTFLEVKGRPPYIVMELVEPPASKDGVREVKT
jgi:polyisoprenyl-phosphate glycosyltransferase